MIDRNTTQTDSNYSIVHNGKEYFPVIGLEIHAELKTKTKMFCSCLNDPDEERPNINVCPICMGHPGTLPVLNKQAIKHVIRIGTSIGGNIANFTEWDRKNYFYPDIPKAYQISQFAHPIIQGGVLKGVTLTRIHLEEDTASLSHDKGDYSLVNFNRSGVPLMEIVTEPVIRDAKTAGEFARELQLLLRYLDAGEANMEKGEMRVEANISISTNPKSHEYIDHALKSHTFVPKEIFSTFGIKTEVKNLNSFKSVERAIDFEIQRHISAIEFSQINNTAIELKQETRGFDETTGKTFSQRSKENSHDYMYFPDPDLPKLFISEIPEFNHNAISSDLPVLPWHVRERFCTLYHMKNEDAEMFVQNTGFRNFFEEIVHILREIDQIKLATNYVTSDLAGLIKKYGHLSMAVGTHQAGITLSTKVVIPSQNFADMISMILSEDLSSRGAKDVLAMMFFAYGNIFIEDSEENKKDSTAPFSRISRERIINKTTKEIAESEGVIQKNDPEALQKIIAELINRYPLVVTDYKSGKEAALMFFVGQIMKISKGSINPAIAKDAIVAYMQKS